MQAKDNDKDTDTPQAIEAAGHKNWERVLLGGNGISGTFRMLSYIVAFAVIFGSLFHFAG
jgi:hypothetical protein